MHREQVTGVNGYIGSHIAYELMKSGYAVRGTVRGGKSQELQRSLKDHYPQLEVVEVSDVATSDLTEALEGVYAICHVASPLPYAADNETMIRTAVEGTMNVLRQAVKAVVAKVVLTSTWAALLDPDFAQAYDSGRVLTEKNWSCVQYPDQVDMSQGSQWIYGAAKAIAERAAWNFAKEHPGLDLAVVNPPTVYGPFVPHFPIRPRNLASPALIYSLLCGENPAYIPPCVADIRDVARAHVSAMELPPRGTGSSEPEAKRFAPFSANVTWRDIVQYLSEHRPDIKHRLPPLDILVDFPADGASTDPSKCMKVLGIKKWIPWQKSINDTVDSLLEAEKNWKTEERLAPRFSQLDGGFASE
ncbi:hypothetical protein AX16_005311 [Volvariella volvacea WC 439]|nr:hypothetical protein AX16_005311 [Volvariella volvacea WC 439]